MKYILLFLAATAFMYLLFAFTIAELNPTKWGGGARFFYSFIEFFIAYIVVAIFVINKPNNS